MSLVALAVVALLPRAAPPSVAVLPVAVPATSSLAAVDLDDALRAGIDEDHARLVPAVDVDGVLRRARSEGLRCDPGVVDCAARLGAFGGFDFVVVPTLAPAGDDGRADGRADEVDDGHDDAPAPVTVTVTVTVTLVDCTTGRAVRAVAGPVAAGLADARRGLQMLARAALAVDGATVTGSLRVDGKGRVVVDDVVRGAAPLTLTLPAGRHTVVAGGGRVRAIAVPVAGTITIAGADDEPDPWPAYGVAAALTGAAIAVGGLAGAIAVAPDPANRLSTSAAAYNDAVTAGRALLVVAGAGAALGGAGIAVWATRSEQ